MAITSVVFYVVTRRTWNWPAWKSVGLLVAFLALDLPFLGANLLKFFDGGYLPLAVGVVFLSVMVIWRIGRTALRDYYSARIQTLDAFITSLDARGVLRTKGVAVFMASNSDGAPPVLTHFVNRAGSLHQTVLLLTITTDHIPVVPKAGRIQVELIAPGIHRVIARCGFMESPNVPAMLAQAIAEKTLPFSMDDVTYYLGRETFIAGAKGRMGPWTESLFAFLNRNAHSAPLYFGVPAEKVVELGVQIDL
jgi:KUP system potassium uptake protein